MQNVVEIAQTDLRQAKVTVLPDGRVNRKNAATFLGRQPKTLADWHSKGIGPTSRMVGGRRFYQIEDLQAFAQGSR